MHMFPFPPRWTARRSAASWAFVRARTPSNYEQNRWVSAGVGLVHGPCSGAGLSHRLLFRVLQEPKVKSGAHQHRRFPVEQPTVLLSSHCVLKRLDRSL